VGRYANLAAVTPPTKLGSCDEVQRFPSGTMKCMNQLIARLTDSLGIISDANPATGLRQCHSSTAWDMTLPSTRARQSHRLLPLVPSFPGGGTNDCVRDAGRDYPWLRQRFFMTGRNSIYTLITT